MFRTSNCSSSGVLVQAAYSESNGHGSVHRKNILRSIHPTRCNVTQFISFGNCSTCFEWYYHPSSKAQITVSTASGIYHAVTATCRYRGRVGNGLRELTVLCASDDGWRYYPKYVEQFPDKINCVTLHLVGYILEYRIQLILFYRASL
jgi:hypothetical protein